MGEQVFFTQTTHPTRTKVWVFRLCPNVWIARDPRSGAYMEAHTWERAMEKARRLVIYRGAKLV